MRKAREERGVQGASVSVAADLNPVFFKELGVPLHPRRERSSVEGLASRNKLSGQPPPLDYKFWREDWRIREGAKELLLDMAFGLSNKREDIPVTALLISVTLIATSSHKSAHASIVT